MSGNALKHYNVQRVSATTHQRIQGEVLAKLCAAIPGLVLEPLRAYGAKSDFGNLSLFFVSDNPDASAKVFQQALAIANGSGTKLMHSRAEHGGSRLAFIYDDLQVDLTEVRSRNFELALDYHAYNGLGGLAGQVARDMGLVLRDTGLFYKVMKGDQLLGEIDVATTWPTILALLGYDAQRWAQGFKTLDDIFSFIASSPYFRTESFTDVEPAAEGVRPTVAQAFATYLAQHPQAQEPVVAPAGDITFLMDRIPGLRERLDAVLAKYAEVRAAAEKLNGNLVHSWTGREGRELGNLMQRLRREFPGDDEMRAWVLSATPHDIQSKVQTLHCLP